MSAITTHVLDLSTGRPATGVDVVLEQQRDETSPDAWQLVGRGATDDDGRLRTLMTHDSQPAPGRYRLTFATGEYFARRGARSFHPQVTVVFEVGGDDSHYHVPLLLSPFGYSTYRGT